SAAEGAFVALQGATFTDAGALDSHTATVDWGDGTSGAAVVSSGTLQARHAYGDNGSYAVTVTVTDDDGGTAVRAFTAAIGNVAPALAALPDQAAQEGAFIQLPPANFMDAGYLDSHSATIDWGDGTSEPAADIALASSPGAEGTATTGTVSARHAYGDNGTFTAVVTVRDDDGGVSSASFRVAVANAAPALAALPDQAMPEGTFIQLPPAAFTDVGYLDTHSATVDWGDGTSEPAADIALAAAPGREGVATAGTIQARHAYGDGGTYSAVVTVRDDEGAVSSASFRVTVANAAPALAGLPDLSAQEGAFIQLPPAAFTDPGYKDTHQATVDWGDGTSEPTGELALTSVPGSEGTATSGTVQARHAYGDNGTFTAVVTVADDDGAVSSATFKVTVTNAAPALAALLDVTTTEGAFVQLPPAAFTDAGYLDVQTASIDWGDGTTEPATDIVLLRSAGQEGAPTAGTVQARHAYADNGVYTAVITVRDDDGGTAAVPMRVTVANVAPAVAALPDAVAGAGGVLHVGGQIPIRTFSAYAYPGAGTLTGYAMGPNVVQTFAPAVFMDPGFDSPAGGTREDFIASVAWGDGQTSTGIAVDETSGSEGAPTVGRAFGAVHQYAANGVYSVTVTLADDDAGAGQRAFSVTVDREPPVTQTTYLGAYLLASAAPAAVPSGLDVFLRSDSQIALYANDPRINEVASGVQRTFWREGQSAPFILYTAPFRTPGAGLHIVEYFSVDERGNEEPHKLLRIGVDDSAPQSSVAYGTAAVHAFGLPLLTPDTPITLSAADLEAAGVAVGVQRITYRLDAGPETPYDHSFTVSSQGMHTLEFGAFDRLTTGEVRKTVRFAVGAFQTSALWGVNGVDGSGTADVAGGVLSNGTVGLNGSVLVSGEVTAGTVTLKGQAQVLGAITQGRSPLIAEPIDLALIGQLAAATSSNSLIPADLLVGGELVMGSGRVHTLTTGTYVLKGLRLNGGASLVIDGRVDLLIDGAVDIGGDAGLNAAGRSEQLMVYVSSNLPVSLLGGAKFVGTVYAPRTELKVAGNARAAGSLGGRLVTLSGTGNIVTHSHTLPPADYSSGGGKGSKIASLAAAGFVPEAGADTAFVLRDLYVFPNPAVGGARPTIHVSVGLADKVTIRIYDVSGQEVHQATIDTPPSIIDDGSGPKYAYEYPWNGHIPSGVYLYTIVAEKSGQPAVRKAGKFAVVR
ncbi:T9SS type A sorting domain-containing protein, partial [bacterium]